jgi:amino acid adenylation domain-containing protein
VPWQDEVSIEEAAGVAVEVQGFELSPQQRRVWSLGEGTGPYRTLGAVMIAGRLALEALAAAVRDAVEQHEILRTSFRRLPGMAEPLQVIGGGAPGWELLGEPPASGWTADLEELFEPLRHAALDLENGPVLRVRLALLGPDRSALCVALPALCADDRGLRNLLAGISRAYAVRRGDAEPSGEPMQYADFASWQNGLLAAATEAEKGYWRRHLPAGEPELPFAAAAAERYSPRAVAIDLDPAVADGLARLAGRERVPLAAVLEAGWYALLRRVTGAAEIVIATACEGRDYEELRGAVGLFTRYLPHRLEVPEGLPFVELAHRVDAGLREGFEWQDWLTWESETGARDAFPGLPFGFDFADLGAAWEAGGVTWTPLRRWTCVERFRWRLAVERRPDGIRMTLIFAETEATGEHADRLLEELHALLADAALRPAAAIGELEILGPRERRELLVELNATAVDFGPPEGLHSLFARQADRTPGLPAVEQGGERLTYRELDARAERLARRLRALGVGPEVRVALCLERSPEMVIAVLGTLKAGGVYVPLDPGYPRERLGFMLSDSGARVVVSHGDALAALPPEAPTVVRVDEPWLADSAQDGPRVESGAVADHLAYVIYTSGSTGRPKGVMISHRAIANRLLWMMAAFPLGADDAVLLKTPFSFDASVWELFVPLLSGARLVLARPGGQQDGAYLAAEIAARGITVLQLVPSMLEVFLEEPGLAGCGGLRRMFCGGEALPPDLRQRFHARLGAELHNLYGPTEVAIDASSWSCPRGERRSTVPIGRPLSNVRLYVLDRGLRPVPTGVPGELYVGGVGLARGYAGRPDLTADRFVPDPCGGEPGARLYRTGDRVRHSLEGDLDFLGREDEQVKVRGFRIEPREIEAQLAEHPRVRQSAVVVRSDSGDARLVAYVAGTPAAPPEGRELRAFLASRLPEYMVPSLVVVLPELPRLPNGKLDRRSLPAPNEALAGMAPATEPRSPLEGVLSGIFTELLGREVGRQESFFDAGGHSLLVTQVVSRVRRMLGVELALRSFFEAPTLEGLAERVAAALRQGKIASAPPIAPAPRDGELPLSFAQQRLWFIEQLKRGRSLLNIPAAVRLSGALDVAALRRTLAEIVRRHEALRTSFPAENGQPRQVISPFRAPALPVLDLSALAADGREGEVRRVILAETRRPFVLETGPLLRLALLRTAESEHLLILVLHHIVSDGWSVGVMLRELAELYGGFASRLTPALPELPVQYADFARWQRGWLQGDVLAAHLEWWGGHLSGGRVAPSELPMDRPRPEAPSHLGATGTLELPRELSRQIAALSRREGTTVFMSLLAAFQAWVWCYGGAADSVVGTDVANRNRIETEGIIGFFVNQLVLRTDLTGDPTWRELLARVREVALRSFAHQDMPFDQLVDSLKIERTLQRAPLFQLKFIFQNAPVPAVELPGVVLTPLDVDGGTALLDFTLALWETEDGLRGWYNYSTDLFEAATLRRMLTDFERVLAHLAEQPDARLGELKAHIIETRKREQRMDASNLAQSNFQKFKSIKPKMVSLPQEESLIRTSFLSEGTTLPLVIEPAVEAMDLTEWADLNRAFLEDKLHRHGALLFRGFAIDSVPRFESLALKICGEIYDENGEHVMVSANVAVPVFYPPDKQLLWHNENSFNHLWPGKIIFCCAEPARRGGETPIVDSRQVFARIPDEVRDAFVAKGVMYQRNYGDGLGLDWQAVFKTSDPSQVEELCRQNRMEFHWKPGGRLRTRCIRPAVIRHPVSGEVSWFNQGQHWHVSCLDPETRRSLAGLFDDQDLPRNLYFGDGSTIPDEFMAAILDAYRELEVSFPWQKGDVMVVDNVLAAHGRNPFEGPRKILVAMGEMRTYDGVA